jgi:hypothetical protein
MADQATVMLYRSQMTAYARLQLDAAQQSLNDHHPDASGCCASCGRSAPCPDQVAAQQVHAWYEAWLNPQPVFGVDHRFTASDHLVRPYVMNAARR